MTTPAYFVPASAIISNIIRGRLSTLVYTVAPHGFNGGLFIRFVVPKQRGMPQINGLTGLVTPVSADSFTVPIDSTTFADFIQYSFPVKDERYVAQAVPISEVAQTLRNATINNNLMKPYVSAPIFA